MHRDCRRDFPLGLAGLGCSPPSASCDGDDLEADIPIDYVDSLDEVESERLVLDEDVFFPQCAHGKTRVCAPVFPYRLPSRKAVSLSDDTRRVDHHRLGHAQAASVPHIKHRRDWNIKV